MESFVLLHMSDLHFGATANRLPSPFGHDDPGYQIQCACQLAGAPFTRPGQKISWLSMASHSPVAVRHLARWIITETPEIGPDLIVVTGDLTSRGEGDDFEAAFGFFGGQPTNSGGIEWVTPTGDATIGAVKFRVAVMPGNHDRYRRHFFRPGGRLFDRWMNRWWACDENHMHDVRTVKLRRNNEKLAILMVDFTLLRRRDAMPPAWGYLGAGRAAPATLERLTAKTKALQDCWGGAVVWALHFPPCFPGVSESLQLHNEEQVVDLAASLDVRLLLAGHTHSARRYRVRDSLVHCVGSASEASSNPDWGFGLLRIDVSGTGVRSVQSTTLQFSESSDDFEIAAQEVHSMDDETQGA